jgi:hypothetical protein
MLVVAGTDLGRVLRLLLLAGACAGLIGSQIGQLAQAVAVYQPGTRTTGIGWAGATGRFGSIVGLAVPGLLGLSLSGQGIIRPAAVSALVAPLRRSKSVTLTVSDSPESLNRHRRRTA